MLPGQAKFSAAYEDWRRTRGRARAPHARRRLLACLFHYLRADSDRDGLPDWSAVIDGKLSTVLYPADDDIDGDGRPNVFDPRPLRADVREPSPARQPRALPAHLRARPAIADLQAKLFREHGIVAVDHTDEHSRFVLAELLAILEHGLPPRFLEQTHLKYLYAFRGHDAEINIAGYHHQAAALSIGGHSAYATAPSGEQARLTLLFTLAHELGHAYLLSQMAVADIQKLAITHGGWGPLLEDKLPLDLLDPVFFLPHPLLGRQNATLGEAEIPRRRANLPSRYAMSNVHEWFADCFAAYVLTQLEVHGYIAPEWRKTLAQPSPAFGWVDVSTLSPALFQWIGKRLASPAMIAHSSLPPSNSVQ